jgi:hypothetical protein
MLIGVGTRKMDVMGLCTAANAQQGDSLYGHIYQKIPAVESGWDEQALGTIEER